MAKMFFRVIENFAALLSAHVAQVKQIVEIVGTLATRIQTLNAKVAHLQALAGIETTPDATICQFRRSQ
jgi:hypothetical protein